MDKRIVVKIFFILVGYRQWAIVVGQGEMVLGHGKYLYVCFAASLDVMLL